jgi:flagellar basal body-associated protein FliL
MKKCDHFRVTTGRRKKSLINISVIIAGVLIAAIAATLSVVLLKKNSTTNQNGILL